MNVIVDIGIVFVAFVGAGVSVFGGSYTYWDFVCACGFGGDCPNCA